MPFNIVYFSLILQSINFIQNQTDNIDAINLHSILIMFVMIPLIINQGPSVYNSQHKRVVVTSKVNKIQQRVHHSAYLTMLMACNSLI